jgi:putative ABC transport system permease protein
MFRIVEMGQPVRGGLAIGVVASLMLARLLTSLSQLLDGIRPTDSPTIIAVSLVMATVAVIACYIPANRAMRVDPMVTLRYE